MFEGQSTSEWELRGRTFVAAELLCVHEFSTCTGVQMQPVMPLAISINKAKFD